MTIFNQKNKKILIKVTAFLAIIIIIVFFLFYRLKKFNPQKITIDDLEKIQLNPPKDYIKKLELVIQKNNDPYTKEKAIFTLTDIAIRKYETEKIVDFLKEMAMNEKTNNLRTAAYANLDLIREHNPLEKHGSLSLSVFGEIKKNSKIILVARVLANVDVEEARVGINKLNKNIELLNTSQMVYQLSLKANQPQEAEFELFLKERGEYEIPVTLILSSDRVDYEEITEEINLVVE